jgi:hypothetical protein
MNAHIHIATSALDNISAIPSPICPLDLPLADLSTNLDTATLALGPMASSFWVWSIVGPPEEVPRAFGGITCAATREKMRRIRIIGMISAGRMIVDLFIYIHLPPHEYIREKMYFVANIENLLI